VAAAYISSVCNGLQCAGLFLVNVCIAHCSGVDNRGMRNRLCDVQPTSTEDLCP
jgi:hypothetical protein